MTVLTLDTRGYVSDPPLIIDVVMNNFFVANYTQTNVHWGQINSLPYLISRYANDMTGLARSIERALEQMLQGHFDTAMVNCEITDLTVDSPLQNIIVSATVYKDGLALDAGRLLTMVQNKISKIETL